ncbi:MAG: DUF2182 domain-containing protein [Actinomycetota bacterium]
MAESLSGQMRRLRAAAAWRPEWPLAVAAALAWTVILVFGGVHGESTLATTPRDAPTPFCPIGPAGSAPQAGIRTTSGSPPATGWAVMTVAMMTPATLPAARYVALNSFRRRRHRAMAVFEAAYLAIFVVFGAMIGLAAKIVPAGTRLPLLVMMLAVAAAWQLTKWKRRAALSCRRVTPLAPSGLRADAACARFGLRQGSRCLASTWPLMALVAFLGHGEVAAMAAVTAVMVVEEHRVAGRRLLRPIAAILAIAAVVAMALGG